MNGSIGFCKKCCDDTWWKKEIDNRDFTVYYVCVGCKND